MKRISFEQLCNIIKERRNRKVLITFHAIGDRDGVASAVALSKFFSSSIVVTPDFITGNAKRMLDESGYTKKIRPGIQDNVDFVIIMDANRLAALGDLGETLAKSKYDILFIDHHLAPDYTQKEDGRLLFNDEKFNSTSSIIYEIMKRAGMTVDKQSAMLLVNGIIADSADFQNSTPMTFMQISELLNIAGMNYSDVAEYFHENVSAADRKLLLRDFSSAKNEVVRKYLFVYGEARTHANVVAEIAIDAGADASLFWSVKKNEASISVRLRSPLDERLSMHLGKIMKKIGPILEGDGGGHPCAAGAYGPNKLRIGEAVSESINIIKEQLSKK